MKEPSLTAFQVCSSESSKFCVPVLSISNDWMPSAVNCKQRLLDLLLLDRKVPSCEWLSSFPQSSDAAEVEDLG